MAFKDIRLQRMGLLSNPEQRKKIVDAIVKYNNKLCFVCYVAGLVWFLALAYQPFNASNYFSENALLPGLVDGEFFGRADAKEYLDQLLVELKKEKRAVPREWVFSKFREIGLDTYVQNYSILYPLGITKGKTLPGQNVYAILRAPRAASTEALVMSTPIRAKETGLTQTSGGLALMLALAKSFRKKPYWSKDIIFLVTDHEQIGMQAWLDGYHDIKAKYIQPGELMGRSGQIQAAVNLEIPSGKLGYTNLKIEGVNGQLPNLDLFNLVVRLIHKHGEDVRLHKQADHYMAYSSEGYKQSLETMMRMMLAQASGTSSGNHGLFLRYHIEAITLEGVPRKRGSQGLDKTGSIIEGVFRSLNNLLERFHQSFFFYVLPSTSTYVSIGLYMPPFGLICAAGLIKAVAIWVSLSSESSDEKTGEKTDTKDKVPESLDKEEDESNCNEEENKDINSEIDGLTGLDKENREKLKELLEEYDEPPVGLLSILPLISISVLMGVLCYTGPTFITEVAPPFRMKIEDTVTFGLLALFSASLFFPKMVNRKSKNTKRLAFDWQLLKSLALIFQSLVLFTISLMNISLAFFMAVVLIPVTVIAHPTKSRIATWIQKFFIFLVSPFMMSFVAGLVLCLDEKHSGIMDILGKSWDSTKDGLVMTLIDNYFFGSWMYPLFSLVIFPNWLFFWGIVHCDL